MSSGVSTIPSDWNHADKRLSAHGAAYDPAARTQPSASL
jgi:hypothetical protein